ncbi:MAG: DNA-processing protein DprA [Pseudomonadota bacterium]
MTFSPSRDRELLFDWLALERVPRVGPLTIARLIEAFGSPAASLRATAEQIKRKTGLGEKTARSISEFIPPADAIRKDMDVLERLGAAVVTRWHTDYPPNLKEIHDPPALLFVRGRLKPADTNAVAVVGTRNPSNYGLEVTESITRDLVRAGVTLVSGLARGIDTACHRTALKEGGRTLGVLGCGVDVVYPRENGRLIQDMAEASAVISEFRPGTPPLATHFYRRNRIVSGLSKAVLVVEAASTSGSLITAGHALDQNRDVCAVPGNVLNTRSRGPHKLIKQGAGLVESAQDILELLCPRPNSEAPRQQSLALVSDLEVLPEQSSRVLAQMDSDPVPIDLLCEALGMEPGRLAGILLDLELRGLIRQYPGKMFALAKP